MAASRLKGLGSEMFDPSASNTSTISAPLTARIPNPSRMEEGGCLSEGRFCMGCKGALTAREKTTSCSRSPSHSRRT